ncbi:Undecaprenyl-phosphate alpha-N-acetylglucosaminyl 1-phosphate transferase [Beggiatoa sp. PS]|nr:Undecaprenyl-phosphate alpha-N-acetylglucosaminyl 1-phosphate transferase [Beggiatoa sp. PS]
MIYLSLLIAVSITTTLLYFLRPLIQRIESTNNLNDNQPYKIPIIGGIALFCGFFLAVLLIDQPLSELRYLGASAIIFLIVGILYDFQEISAKKLLVAEIIVALILSIKGGAILNNIGAILLISQEIELGVWTWPLTIIAIISIINALKISDGIEGLAAGLALIALCSLALASWKMGLIQALEILALIITVVITFLSFNLRFFRHPKKRVLLGTTGCLFLGLILAWFMITLSQEEQRAILPVTILWIFALPLFEMASFLIYQLFNRLDLFDAEWKPIHYYLLAADFTHFQTLSILLSFAFGFALVGIIGLLLAFSEIILFWTFNSLLIFYFVIHLAMSYHIQSKFWTSQ